MNTQDDYLIWKHTLNGRFSVKNAYLSTLDINPSNPNVRKSIWNLHIPPKLKIFTLFFLQSILLTNVNRARSHLTSDPSCLHCPGKSETMLHLFRGCPKACLIWSAMGCPKTKQRTFNLEWEAWVAVNIFQKSCMFQNAIWSQWFIFICWFIWK